MALFQNIFKVNPLLSSLLLSACVWSKLPSSFAYITILLQWPLAGLTVPLLPAAPTPAFCLFSTAESKMFHEVSHCHRHLAQISPLLPAHVMSTPSFTVCQLPWLLGAVAGEWQDCPPPLRFCHQPSLYLEHFPDIPITHFLQGYLMPSPQQYFS